MNIAETLSMKLCIICTPNDFTCSVYIPILFSFVFQLALTLWGNRKFIKRLDTDQPHGVCGKLAINKYQRAFAQKYPYIKYVLCLFTNNSNNNKKCHIYLCFRINRANLASCRFNIAPHIFALSLLAIWHNFVFHSQYNG